MPEDKVRNCLDDLPVNLESAGNIEERAEIIHQITRIVNYYGPHYPELIRSYKEQGNKIIKDS